MKETAENDRIRVGVFDPNHPEYGVGAYFTTSEAIQRRAQMFEELIYFELNYVEYVGVDDG